MSKAQESEDAPLTLTKPNSQSNLEAAYRLAGDIESHMLHLGEARGAILEIAGSDGVFP